MIKYYINIDKFYEVYDVDFDDAYTTFNWDDLELKNSKEEILPKIIDVMRDFLDEKIISPEILNNFDFNKKDFEESIQIGRDNITIKTIINYSKKMVYKIIIEDDFSRISLSITLIDIEEKNIGYCIESINTDSYDGDKDIVSGVINALDDAKKELLVYKEKETNTYPEIVYQIGIVDLSKEV